MEPAHEQRISPLYIYGEPTASDLSDARRPFYFILFCKNVVDIFASLSVLSTDFL